MKSKFIVAIGFVGALILFGIAGNLYETNNSGYYQVKQAFVTGDMSVRNKPGTYGQWLGDISTYRVAGIHYFSKHDIDGGSSEYSSPVMVTFNGNSKAEVSGVLKYKLSEKKQDQLELHEQYGSGSIVKDELIRQYVAEVLIQTAPLMTAEEAYAPRKSEFKKIAEDQLKYGIYKKKTRTKKEIDYTFNEKGEREQQTKESKVVELVLDEENQQPIVDTISPLKRYGIEVLTFTIKDFDFDAKTEELIAKKKETEMQKVLAETDAQKAQQDAIKAIAQGKANVAKAEAMALVEKKRDTIKAEKEYEVAKMNRKRAEEEAKAALVKKEAEAKANKLLVSAGLTPIEKAQIDMKTSIGVAAELAKLKLPDTFIGGSSGGNGSAMNPIEAMGIKSFYDLTKVVGQPADAGK